MTRGAGRCLEHLRAQGSHDDPERLRTLGVEGGRRAVRLTLVLHGLEPRQRAEHTEVVADVSDRLVVAQPHHVLDHDLVAQADAQRESATAGGADREALLSDRQRMARERRDDRRAELDPRHLAADERQRREGVVAEDVRHPVRVEAVRLRSRGLGDDVVERAVVDRSPE
jgi:hypothetical protein